MDDPSEWARKWAEEHAGDVAIALALEDGEDAYENLAEIVDRLRDQVLEEAGQRCEDIARAGEHGAGYCATEVRKLKYGQ